MIGDGFVIELGSVDPAAQHLHTIYHDLGNVLGRGGLTMRTIEKPPRSMHYAVFDSAIGACGVAWSDAGVTRFQLPEASREATV